MTVKERLFKAAIKQELKGKYEEDKYGIHCLGCGVYNPIPKKILHSRRCPVARLERIAAIE